ncbi:RNA-directed DNA polymerase [Candidatus Wolfebacteria bacterium]|nr:RNA-directed DNA polymerase [Candidatus Wolfebacteria bacterium]
MAKKRKPAKLIKFNLCDSLFTFQNLYKAYLDCRKRKRNTINALRFESNLENNLWKLLEDLRGCVYKPGVSVCFAVKEPVIREIFAANFRDRVVHHLFVRAIEPHFEKYFIYDSYACRKGKGTLLAMRRLQKFIRRAQNIEPRNYNNWHYLKADILGFFMHINKKILNDLILQKILTSPFSEKIKEELKWLAGLIIFHNPTENYFLKGDKNLLKTVPRQKSLFGVPDGIGLPIGNLTSQFFANVYLNELDQFIKRKLKCEFYGRYVDDFYIIQKDKEKLKEFHGIINRFLKDSLFLELNLKKCYIQPLVYGVDFVGYFVKFWRIYPRKRIVKKFKNKLWIFKKYRNSIKTSDIQNSIVSYFGHFIHANSYNFILKIKQKHPWIGNVILGRF